MRPIGELHCRVSLVSELCWGDQRGPRIAVFRYGVQDSSDPARIAGWSPKLPLILRRTLSKPSASSYTTLRGIARQNLLWSLPFGQSRFESIDPLLIGLSQALPLDFFTLIWRYWRHEGCGSGVLVDAWLTSIDCLIERHWSCERVCRG